jgi:NADP-reducing hydrogenase subunit HndC
MGFYKKQLRIALRNCGFVDPENIDDSIARDAYQALGKVLSEMTPEEAIKEMKDSGLRGTWRWWFPYRN